MALLNLVICIVWLSVCNLSDALQHSFKVASNNAYGNSSENQLQIDAIDVKCDKSQDGMFVTIQFNQPFSGVIYSRNNFNDPKCRYVSDGENQETFKFVVPFKGCGSKTACASCNSIENVLIIQQDEEVQSAFDIARKVSCSRIGIDDAKKIHFKPFVVDMLDVITLPTDNGSVNCWMDIKRGIYPKLSPIGDAIKIGEDLTVMVYLQDDKSEYDLSVRNCWAYDNSDFDNDRTGKVQLSDASGCSMKKKLFGSWQKTTDVRSSNATLLLHNVLKAFRFPDESQIYLKCDFEICHGTCAEAICDTDFNQITQIDCNSDPLNAKCLIRKYGGVSGTTPFPAITLNDRQQFENEFQTTTAVPTTTTIPFTISTRKPYAIEDRQQFRYPTPFNHNSIDLNQQEKLIDRPSDCADSANIQCIRKVHYADSTTTISNDELSTTTQANVYRTDTDLPDFEEEAPIRNVIEILTFKPPMAFNPPLASVETRRNGETGDSIQTPLICKIGHLDPRCPNPTPTATPPTYLPASFGYSSSPRAAISREPETYTYSPTTSSPTTEEATQQTTEKFFICVPGSNDYRCDVNSQNRPEDNEVSTTTENIDPYDFIDIRGNEQDKCSNDPSSPGCKGVSSDLLTVKSAATTTAPFSITTTEIATDSPTTENQYDSKTTRFPPRAYVESSTRTVTTEQSAVSLTDTPTQAAARQPVCYPGALDPRCREAKPFSPPPPRNMNSIISFGTLNQQRNLDNTYNQPDTQNRFNLPRTSDSSESEFPANQPIEQNIQNVRPSSTSRPLNCYFGSLDPRCQRSTTKTPVEQTTKDEKSNEIPVRANYQIPLGTRDPVCYPGSRDPLCHSSTFTSTEGSSNSYSATATTTFTSEQRDIYENAPSTRAPTCYPGSRHPACQATSSTTSSRSPNIYSTTTTTTSRPQDSYEIPISSQAPRCYPGSRDPACQAGSSTTSSGSPNIYPTTSTTTTSRPHDTYEIPISSQAPTCYPGSQNPACQAASSTTSSGSANIYSTTTTSRPRDTYEIPISSQAPRCYPGSRDPACQAVSSTTSSGSPNIYSTTTTTTTTTPSRPRDTYEIPISSQAPRCYPGSRDPACQAASSTTSSGSPNIYSTTTTTTSRPRYNDQFPSSTQAARCYPGSRDLACQSATATSTTASSNSYSTTTTNAPQPRANYQFPSSTQAPSCYPGSQNPLCQFGASSSSASPVNIYSTATPTAAIPYSGCVPGSLDPRCKPVVASYNQLDCNREPRDPRCPSFSRSFQAATYLPPFEDSHTESTFRPSTTTIGFNGRPTFSTTSNSNSQGDTTRFVGPTGTQSPVYSSTTGRTSTTTTFRPTTSSIPTTTSRRIFSSPQPFNTRPTTTTTTENPLCYPGSPIAGCESSVTTPSYCFPGSKDKRCPQLPDTFSTQLPSTYLPPYFPDVRINRVKRQIVSPKSEIVRFSMSFKPYNVN